MEKQEILLKLNKALMDLNEGFQLDGNMLDTIVLDVSRVMDNKYTDAINNIKNNLNVKINSVQKEAIRKYFLGYPITLPISVDSFKPNVEQEKIAEAYSLVSEGFDRNASTMVDSLIARIKKLFLNQHDNTTDDYLEYIQDIQIGKQQLIILNVNADDSHSADNVAQIIEEKYDSLSNFHYMIIIFNDGKTTTSWKTISDIALFMEQFKKENHFSVYENKNKSRRIEELVDFVKSNNHVQVTEDILLKIKKFYDGVSYGFQFDDLFITDDGKTKILVMQKVELDESPKKCPSCLNEIVRGNSYPSMLYKSFECQNPSCSSRSKIGRGKRYDLYGAKRQMMLNRNSELDAIDDETYSAFRRDIIKNQHISIERLILLYTWSGDSILTVNSEFNKETFKDRDILNVQFTKFDKQSRMTTLDIYKLFNSIADNFIFDNYEVYKKEKFNDSLVINGNSTDLIPFITEISGIEKFSGAITSPPYYNAREYSQWPNLLCYLIDMMASAKAVLTSLTSEGVYIYNIGDVVGQDNVYIQSNMSKRRQMLGFYSVFIFELIGFKTIGNLIWDKGEVQSKRNSSPNHISGYIKPVNAYEHCWIFSKNSEAKPVVTRVEKIDTVKKINSKGENTFGHTAPYPVEIAKLIIPYVDKEGYVVDPFLGSGTTLIALQEEGYKGVGFELDSEYFKLACKKINESKLNLLALIGV